MSRPVSPARKRNFLPPEFVRAMLAGHSALGLAFAALIYIVCLSGTLSVFLYELQRWEQPDAPIVEGSVSPKAFDAAVRNGNTQALADNAAHDVFVMAPGRIGPRFIVSYHDHETGVEGSWLADAAGNLVTRAKAPWSEFVADLHMHLHLPRTWGLFLVGLTGVALLSSLISGLLSHPRIFKDAFAFRRGGSYRLQEADLHNRLGVWGSPFHVAVSLTGALLGLSTLIVGVLAMAAYDGDSKKAFATILGPQPSEDETAAPIPDIAAMIAGIQAKNPDAAVSNIHVGHIGKVGQIITVNMRSPGHLPFGNPNAFNAKGELISVGGLETGTVGQQILGVLQPIHFGWFGGIAVKIAYGLLGLALTVITHTGVTIWLARRRDKGRPAPGWERVWAAVGWSQPLAFATTAIAALLSAPIGLIWIYLGTVAASFAVARWAADGFATTLMLRALSGAAFIAAVGVHIALWRQDMNDPMAWAVNATMVLCAIILAAPAVLNRHGVAHRPAQQAG